MKDSEKQETNSWIREARLGFIYGFTSMAGGLLMMSMFAHREQIRRVIKYAIQEAK